MLNVMMRRGGAGAIACACGMLRGAARQAANAMTMTAVNEVMRRRAMRCFLTGSVGVIAVCES